MVMGSPAMGTSAMGSPAVLGSRAGIASCWQ